MQQRRRLCRSAKLKIEAALALQTIRILNEIETVAVLLGCSEEVAEDLPSEYFDQCLAEAKKRKGYER